MQTRQPALKGGMAQSSNSFHAAAPGGYSGQACCFVCSEDAASAIVAQVAIKKREAEVSKTALRFPARRRHGYAMSTHIG